MLFRSDCKPSAAQSGRLSRAAQSCLGARSSAGIAPPGSVVCHRFARRGARGQGATQRTRYGRRLAGLRQARARRGSGSVDLPRNVSPILVAANLAVTSYGDLPPVYLSAAPMTHAGGYVCFPILAKRPGQEPSQFAPDCSVRASASWGCSSLCPDAAGLHGLPVVSQSIGTGTLRNVLAVAVCCVETRLGSRFDWSSIFRTREARE